MTSRPDRSSRTRVGAWPISVGAFALWLTGAHLCAQTVQPAARSGSDDERPAYALQRDQEDWSFLRDPSRRRDVWDPIKFIPLSAHGESFLSLGGEWREQFERFDNDQWGSVPDDTSGYLLQRYMFHADVRIGQSVRGFVQVKSGLETGRASGPRPTDEDRLDLHQAFVDVSVGRAAQSPVLTFRVGRQEFNLGTARLVSVREAPNVRQSFDAVRAILRRGLWRLDTFVSRPVTTEVGLFDDGWDASRALWGVYAVRQRRADRRSGFDLYYLGLQRDRGRFDQGAGPERRHTAGARLWGRSGRLDYNTEAAWQWGEFAGNSIRAWTAASDTGWHLDLPGRPRLGVRADITSGDSDRNDDVLGTFNALFPKGAYFGLIAPVGPYNHMDLHPQVDVSLARGWGLSANWLWFWRTEIDDGLYGVAGQLLRSGRDTRERFVGHSPGVEVTKSLAPHLTLVVQASLFTAGPFIEEMQPARDIHFIAAIATYRF